MRVDRAGRKAVGGVARSESPLIWLSRRKDKTGAALIGAEQLMAGGSSSLYYQLLRS
jgi:hypothetical protein